VSRHQEQAPAWAISTGRPRNFRATWLLSLSSPFSSRVETVPLARSIRRMRWLLVSAMKSFTTGRG
jgi:hypothetical protein